LLTRKNTPIEVYVREKREGRMPLSPPCKKKKEGVTQKKGKDIPDCSLALQKEKRKKKKGELSAGQEGQ